MTRAIALLTLALASSPALATPHNSVSMLVGASSALDDDPASLRLSVRGDLGLVHNDTAGLSVLVPVTVASSEESGLGLSGDRLTLEIPVSLRGTLLPHGPIRPYGDLGVGVVTGSSIDLVPMTRAAVGLELGPAERVSFVIEPAELRTYYKGDSTVSGYSLMLGVVAPF